MVCLLMFMVLVLVIVACGRGIRLFAGTDLRSAKEGSGEVSNKTRIFYFVNESFKQR